MQYLEVGISVLYLEELRDEYQASSRILYRFGPLHPICQGFDEDLLTDSTSKETVSCDDARAKHQA